MASSDNDLATARIVEGMRRDVSPLGVRPGCQRCCRYHCACTVPLALLVYYPIYGHSVPYNR